MVNGHRALREARQQALSRPRLAALRGGAARHGRRLGNWAGACRALLAPVPARAQAQAVAQEDGNGDVVRKLLGPRSSQALTRMSKSSRITE